MNLQKYISGILGVFIALFWGGFLSVSVTSADDSIMLPAFPVAQRFSPADSNGDGGMHNCMPAALTSALSTLSASRPLVLPPQAITYPHIRRTVRSAMPDPDRGIAPSLLISATDTITQKTVSLSFVQVPPRSWELFLRQELAKGYPVIVHVSDRYALYNPFSQADASHVVVVVGLDDTSVTITDSWDGNVHTVSRERFAAAWGKGNYRWLAFRFTLKEHADFASIVKHRFRSAI